MATPESSDHAFTQWAHDPARTIDERYLVYLVCRVADYAWWLKLSREEQLARRPRLIEPQALERFNLNPALVPAYSREETDHAASVAGHLVSFEPWLCHHTAKPIRDAGGLRFFPGLEKVSLGCSGVRDLSWLAELPHLRSLALNSGELEDLSVFRLVPGLRELSLNLDGALAPLFAPPLLWPDASPLGSLQKLEILRYGPNAAALRDLSFPAVREAGLSCVGQKDCHCLPDMPGLTLLSLRGVESLAGIDRYPLLRRLVISGPLRDFGDLPSLRHLTSLEVNTHWGWPRDVRPLARLPELRYVKFTQDSAQPMHYWAIPRDYWPLTGAPRLRQIEAPGADCIALDLQAINAALTPWDEDFLAPQAKSLPPLRFIASEKLDEKPPYEAPAPGDLGADPEMRFRERLWMAQRVRDRLNALVGHEYGVPSVDETRLGCREGREINLTIESQDLADRLPEALDIVRECMAGSPHDWWAHIWIRLRVPDALFTDQQRRWLAEIEAKYRERDDEIDHEHWAAKQRHLIDSTFQFRVASEEGENPDPDDFRPPGEAGGGGVRQVAGASAKPPGGGTRGGNDADEGEEAIPPEFRLRPYDEQEQNTGDDGVDDGDVATEIDTGPPEWFIEDHNAHPLADSYSVYGTLLLERFTVIPRTRATAETLMGRPVDEVIEGADPSG
jgi:hypothetical protein